VKSTFFKALMPYCQFSNKQTKNTIKRNKCFPTKLVDFDWVLVF